MPLFLLQFETNLGDWMFLYIDLILITTLVILSELLLLRACAQTLFTECLIVKRCICSYSSLLEI